jgi:hypothetical protein
MITGKTIVKESFLDMISTQYQNYIVFFVDDSSGTLSDTSTMSDATALEIVEQNGYTRKTLLTSSFTYSSGRVSTDTDELQWSFTGSVSFTHLCYAVGATLTNGDSTGQLERIVAANDGNSLSFVNGESYTLPSFKLLLRSSL